MARRKVKTYIWTRTNHPDIGMTVYRDTDPEVGYVVVYDERLNVLDGSFHTYPDVRTATAAGLRELTRLGKLYSRKNIPASMFMLGPNGKPMRVRSSYTEAGRSPGPVERAQMVESFMVQGKSRRPNASLPRGEDPMDVLYAEAAYGRAPTIEDWDAGKDFKATNPPIWKGGLYFSIRDVDYIHSLGYRRISIGGAEGFDVDLVTNPPRAPSP